MKGILVGIFCMFSLVLVSCGGGGGSSSGGNHSPLKSICQTCTYDNECESNDCRRFTSGQWRCVPYQTPAGYRCPAGQYKIFENNNDACQ